MRSDLFDQRRALMNAWAEYIIAEKGRGTMVEPTIPEMLRVGLKAVQEYWEKPEERFRVHWPDDLEGSGALYHAAG